MSERPKLNKELNAITLKPSERSSRKSPRSTNREERTDTDRRSVSSRKQMKEKNMKKVIERKLWLGTAFIAAFVLWTVLVRWVDVQPIGPNGSSVGFATVNGFVHDRFGVHWWLYTVTDWLGLVPIGIAFGFAVLGLVQLVKRKSLLKVDRSILVLGGFYILVFAAYFLFEKVAINYRPVLINGYLEASYPSSTTMLVLCVIPTAMMQLKIRIRNKTLKNVVLLALALFAAFMVIGRLVSGVHWLTDIIGGVLFSVGLVMFYAFAIKRQGKSRKAPPYTV